MNDEPHPTVHRGSKGRPGPVLFTIDVDGETFAVRRSTYGGTHYDWLSGPNEGYGFGSGESPERDRSAHEQEIRIFLSMIDPEAGYIADA